jgi:hypothetical protein
MPFVARKTFVRRFHPILRMRCHLEDKSAMNNVFTVGEVVPYSSVYRITHYPHTGEEALTRWQSAITDFRTSGNRYPDTCIGSKLNPQDCSCSSCG